MRTLYEINNRGEVQVWSENFIVVGDLHIPQQDDEVVDLVIQEGIVSDIKTLVINGDFTNSDVFSEFARKQTNAGWEVEKNECRKVMGRFQNWFTKIFFILGNHDARLLRRTSYALQLDDILRIIVDGYDPNQIIATDHDHILINHNWLVCHPKEYSRIPGQKARQIGEKYERNTIVGHNHILSHTTIGSNGFNRHYIDGGCALDFNRVEYAIMNTSTFTPWAKGFVKVVNDFPVIRTEKHSKSFKSTKVW